MGILDIADEFCNPLNQMNGVNSTKTNVKLENKLHEQPLVTFIEDEHEKNVIYREEL